MPEAPDDERPVGAVPHAAEHHRRHQVDVRALLALPAAAEGDVQVVPQPGAEGQVPAAPELGDRRADVRVVEVLGEPEPDHQGQADRHVGVAGEVEEQLERVGDRAQPGVPHRRVRQRERRVDERRDRVGDQHLLAEARHEPADSAAELLLGVGAVPELLGDHVVADDRAGDELGEQRDERREVDEVPGRAAGPPVDVDQVRHRLEDEERQADRQDDPRPGERLQPHRAEQRVEAVDPEVGVLEVAQRAEVADHPRPQPAPLADRRDRRFHPVRAQVAARGDPDQQPQEVGPPPAVEEPARRQDPRRSVLLGEQVVDPQEDRQEPEEKYVGAEDHRRRGGSSARSARRGLVLDPDGGDAVVRWEDQEAVGVATLQLQTG